MVFTKTSTPVKIALIGIGLIGSRHAQHILQNDSASLAAVVDGAPGAAEKARRLGCPYFASVDAMLQDANTRPDAAIIATPNHTHVAVAKQLLAAKIHVLIEKPVAISLKEGGELLQYMQTTKCKAIVGHHRRFNPYVATAKAAIDRGMLGEITAISGLWTLEKPLSYFSAPTEWRRDPHSGGPLLINSIHDVDILAYLFGPIEEIFAMEVPNRRGFEVMEGAAMTMRFKSGAVGNFITADNTPSPHNFEAGTGENPTIPKAGKDFLRIFGTMGSLSIPDMVRSNYDNVSHDQEKGWLQKIDEDKLVVPNEFVAPFDMQLDNLIQVVRGEEEARCPVEAGVRAVAVCEAVLLSLREKRMVNVSDLLFASTSKL